MRARVRCCRLPSATATPPKFSDGIIGWAPRTTAARTGTTCDLSTWMRPSMPSRKAPPVGSRRLLPARVGGCTSRVTCSTDAVLRAVDGDGAQRADPDAADGVLPAAAARGDAPLVLRDGDGDGRRRDGDGGSAAMATAAAAAAVVEAGRRRARRRPSPSLAVRGGGHHRHAWGSPTADCRPPSAVRRLAADVLLAIRDTPPGTDSRAADRPSPSRRPAEHHTRELTLCRTHPRVPQVRTPRTSTYGSAV